MIERVLVPLDGSLLAEQILPLLRRMLNRYDSEVILVRAAVPPPVENSMMIADGVLAVAREYLLGIQERLAKEGVRVKAVCRIGSAMQVILDVADEENATLLALATHGQTGLRRLLLGSVAETLMRKSPVPVFVVRPFWSYDLLPGNLEKPELQPLRSILLPVERNDLTLAALSPLLELAHLFDSSVVLLHVIGAGAANGKSLPKQRQEGQEILDVCSRILEGQGVETLCLLEEGDPAQEILRVARSRASDVIAMVTHGRTGIDRLLRGSVTEKVLRESICPILVVRSHDPSSGGRSPAASPGTRA